MRIENGPHEPTHIAYADETQYNIGRYRGIALVTTKMDNVDSLNAELRGLFEESGIASEFKWTKLHGVRERFAALKMLEWTINKAVSGLIRVDVLTWDVEDKRHKIRGRDDIANLQRMYYHLFRNVLCNRWPDGSIWRLCPDENTAIDWARMDYLLRKASTRLESEPSVFTVGKVGRRLKQEFGIEQIMPAKSEQEPLVQIADLFAGLAVYSRSSFERYLKWQQASSGQMILFPEEYGFADSVGGEMSKADNQRFLVLKEFDKLCKNFRLGVSLKTSRGLKTFDPTSRINFWFYEVQHEHDKAPVKSKG